MWGQSEPLVLDTGTAAVQGGIASHQICNVRYGHPTTWTILVGASVVWTPVEVAMGIQLRFDIGLGLGLTRVDLPSVVFQWPVGELPSGQGALKVCSRFEFPPPISTGEPNFVDKFPAESIQIQARLSS